MAFFRRRVQSHYHRNVQRPLQNQCEALPIRKFNNVEIVLTNKPLHPPPNTPARSDSRQQPVGNSNVAGPDKVYGDRAVVYGRTLAGCEHGYVMAESRECMAQVTGVGADPSLPRHLGITVCIKADSHDLSSSKTSFP